MEGTVDVRPCDAQEMADWSPVEPDLELEGSHLGRGKMYYDSEVYNMQYSNQLHISNCSFIMSINKLYLHKKFFLKIVCFTTFWCKGTSH